MKKSDYAQYLKQRHLKKSSELSVLVKSTKEKYEDMIRALPDDVIIDSYRRCSNCGKEWLSRQEMDSLIQKYNNPERIFNEMPSGCE